MKEKKWCGIFLCIFLVAGVIIAGCSSDSGDTSASTSTTVPTVVPVAKYIAGDIVAKTDSGNEQQLYVITRYDSATDEYGRAWIFRNSDGSWGHFIDSKTDKSTRTIVEKVYPVKVAHVTISSIPVITPTAAVATTITYVGLSPVVSSLSPNSGVKDGSVTVTITGNNFQTGATAKLIQPGSGAVTGTATSVSSTSITTTFNLNQLESGKYNVLVINPDGRSDILSSAFTIGAVGPVITAISPVTAELNETVDSITISGNNFGTDGAVKVTFLLGSSVIDCPTLSSDLTTITCGPVLLKKSSSPGVQAGIWDVRVLNIDGQQSGTASQKFTITNSTSIAG